MRVLYLYAGSREAFYESWRRGEAPDTQLLGLNYMKNLGIDAEFIEWRFCEWLRRINFNLVHIPYLFAIKKYDIVFLCAGLPLVFIAKYVLRWKKPKFVIYNTFLANARARNQSGVSSFITRKAIENLDTIICTARAQVPPLLAAGIAPEKIKFAPIGIDVKKFVIYSPSFSRDQSTGYILYVGRDMGRDYKTLFDAVRGLPVQVVVATKPEAVAGLTVPPNVEIRFNVPYGDMPALYANAAFVVTPLKRADNPSGSETSGQYGYLEPMAAGKTVIVSDKPVVRDYITHEKTGILVLPEDSRALRAAIEQLTADEPMRNTLGAVAQKSVLENFTSERWARALAAIFKSLM